MPSPQHTNVCSIDHTRSSADYKVKASSVCPIGSSPPSHSTRRSPQGKTANTSQLPFRQNLSSQYHVGVFFFNFASLYYTFVLQWKRFYFWKIKYIHSQLELSEKRIKIIFLFLFCVSAASVFQPWHIPVQCSRCTQSLHLPQ